MALQVNASFDTPFGETVNTTYWRWVNIGIDVPSGQAHGVLYAYLNEAAFAAGKQPIGQKTFTLSGQDFAALVLQDPAGANLSERLSKAVYDFVKANDTFFATAVDA